MAQKRMFSLDIVGSEEFLSMPISSQALYFHLGMHADDDGFINPKTILRLTGSGDDDLKVLLAKRFTLSFETGIIVIKHWLIHNLIRGDRYKPTRYQEEKKLLIVKENKAYTELSPTGRRNGNQMATQVRLGKDRLGEVSIENTAVKTAEGFKDEVNLIFEVFYKTINPQISFARKDSRDAAEWLITNKGFEQTLEGAKYACQIFAEEYAPSIKTPAELKHKWANLVKYKITKEGPKKGNLKL